MTKRYESGVDESGSEVIYRVDRAFTALIEEVVGGVGGSLRYAHEIDEGDGGIVAQKLREYADNLTEIPDWMVDYLP